MKYNIGDWDQTIESLAKDLNGIEKYRREALDRLQLSIHASDGLSIESKQLSIDLAGISASILQQSLTLAGLANEIQLLRKELSHGKDPTTEREPSGTPESDSDESDNSSQSPTD